MASHVLTADRWTFTSIKNRVQARPRPVYSLLRGQAKSPMSSVFPLSSVLVFISGFLAVAQDNAPLNPQPRVVISSSEASSATVIAIPPDTSWTGTVLTKAAKSHTAEDVIEWAREQLR